MYALPILGIVAVLAVVGFVLGGGIYTLVAVAVLLVFGLLFSPLLVAGYEHLKQYTAERKSFRREHDID